MTVETPPLQQMPDLPPSPPAPKLREEVVSIPESVVADLAEIETEKARLDQVSKAIIRTFFTAIGQAGGPKWTINLGERTARRMVAE